MSILSRVAGDIESAIGLKNSPPPQGMPAVLGGPMLAPMARAAATPLAPIAPIAQKPQVMAANQNPVLTALLQNSPPGVEPNSYTLGLKHGHAAALSVMPSNGSSLQAANINPQ